MFSRSQIAELRKGGFLSEWSWAATGKDQAISFIDLLDTLEALWKVAEAAKYWAE